MVKINEETCKGCGLCIHFCPAEGLLRIDEDRVNAKGWSPAACTDQSRCTSCALCALMCPDAAIEVYKQIQAKEGT